MTVSVTSPAPPDGTGQQHRFVAIGFGFGGLVAAKALKHAQLNITDALVFLVRITAQGTSRLAHQTSLWVQLIPAAAAVGITVGALMTLSVVADKRNKNFVARSGSWRTRRIEHARNTLMTIFVGSAKALAPYGLRRSRPMAKGWL
ncbi:MAG TPA: hypothetical protein VKI00_26995 [Mycobacterium sp.]|uniref:hypothetical protein n=1 Tax=Mycobacterium sp. TaxID=1785 RepID=UPI002D1157DD|nr:hypothetical protein [Mycobacterium sp.]HME79171.1 hypothetical protein [Mycobacterium sp.]